MADRYISDDDIVLGPMGVEGVFTLEPHTDWSRGRKGALRFKVTSDKGFKHAMHAAVLYAMKDLPGRMIPSRAIRDSRKVPTEIILKFDAPPRQRNFADLQVNLAAKLFLRMYRHVQGSATERRLLDAVFGRNQPLTVVKGQKPATTRG